MRNDTQTLSRETTKTQAAAETLALDLLSSASDGGGGTKIVECTEDDDSEEEDGCGCFGTGRGRRSVSVSTPDIWRISSRHRVYGKKKERTSWTIIHVVVWEGCDAIRHSKT
jgi:hypothetical protein